MPKIDRYDIILFATLPGFRANHALALMQWYASKLWRRLQLKRHFAAQGIDDGCSSSWLGTFASALLNAARCGHDLFAPKLSKYGERERRGERKRAKKGCVLSVFCLCACDESDLVLYKISFFQDQILFSDNFNSFK